MPTSWHPGKLLELSGGYWKTCALHAAVKLDVFTVIGGKQLSSQQVAKATGASEDGISRLLNSLAALGLLAKNDGFFANIEPVGELLSQDSPRYIGHIIQHHHHLMESWSHLDEAVKSGQPIRKRSAGTDAKYRESFLMGMFNIAMAVAPKIIPQLNLRGRKHLMDLGGGPGTYAIQFCRHHPDLSATVIDLPTTRPFAEKTIARFKMTDRIRFREGNYLEDAFEGTFDAAWLSHILHGEGPDHCREIIRKAVRALEPGGLIAIHEFILDDSMDGPVFPALFSLNMLLGTPSGQAYSEKQLRRMLEEAGVGEIERIPLDTPNDSAILTGIRSR